MIGGELSRDPVLISDWLSGVRDKLFVMERNSTSDKFIPALTWFKVT